MATDDLLVQAHSAVAARCWADACHAFASANHGVLDAADLEAWGLTALLAGDHRTSDSVRERAHHAFLDSGIRTAPPQWRSG